MNWEILAPRSVGFLSYRDQDPGKNMESTKSDTNADVKEKAREVMEMVEAARIWYIDSNANITFQLFGPIFGPIILPILFYWLWQNLPGILSLFASILAAAGGYGKKLMRMRAGNKWSSAPALYDQYDYYTSGTEHYEAQQEVNDIIRSSNMASEVKPGAANYNGAFVRPGGHLDQRQVTERVSYV